MELTKKIPLIGIMGLLCLSLSAQHSAKEIAVGQKVDDLPLNGVQYAAFTKARFADFKGKWLILDFWSTGCISCIKSFPQINKIINTVKGNYQFILVGKEHPSIRSTFEKYRSYYGLQIPVMYDSVLFTYFQVRSVPRIIIIDTSGKLYAIGSTADLTEEKLQDLVASKQPAFNVMMEQFPYPQKTILDSDVIRLSSLQQYERKQIPFVPYFFFPYHYSYFNKQGVEFYGATLLSLYQIAYFGKESSDPMDSVRYGRIWPSVHLDGILKEEVEYDGKSNRNLYNYKLLVQDSNVSSSELQVMMQKDLSNVLPYHAEIQYKRMPCYFMKLSKRIKRNLQTKGQTPRNSSMEESSAGFSIQNGTIRDIIQWVYIYHPESAPIINASHFNENIDFTLEAAMAEYEDVKNQLQKKGIRLLKRKRKMFTLVLSKKTFNPVKDKPLTYDLK